MGQEKTTLEIIAPSVDEAVTRGLNQLGLPREAVEIEVLDSGSRGLFGIGSRQSRVRLTIRQEQPKPVEVIGQHHDDISGSDLEREESPEMISPATTEEQEKALQVSRQVVSDLLAKMKIKARIVSSLIPSEDGKEPATVLIDIQGDDLSILIGRRSETLNALQYISNLIVNKEIGRWVPLMIDIQGYRTRRERQLRILARKMAEQAIRSGRKESLEPMPASERRIIHLELRDHPQVVTESVGEEPNRKVTIYLRK